MSGREIRTVAITSRPRCWVSPIRSPLAPVVPALLAWICSSCADRRAHVERVRRDIAGPFFRARVVALARARSPPRRERVDRELIVEAVPQFQGRPFLVVAILMVASVPVRLLIPNITGFLATTIPIAMSIGTAAGVNPLICGLAVMIAGDAVLYYPAQSASSLAVYERGYLTAPQIFRFGVWMTVIAFVVVLTIALPWWRFVGEPLATGP